ncbi:MAG: lipopolysaccharide transport periplasmic protein LptA [Helicobacteraceae bacterium]|nr:lipopolysaccharide transport periplasmic protein LptA [Helicobacteraceae bacterium]
MKYIYLLTFFLLISLQAEQLKVVANSFNGDEKSGITVFKGDVKIAKGSDELNASNVTIYTNAKRKPTKYIAIGNVSFFIKTENESRYKGTAGKAIFIPANKEYHFYENVHIEQIDEKKEIIGEEVIINTVEGKARAKRGDTKPVVMTFEIDEEEEK